MKKQRHPIFLKGAKARAKDERPESCQRTPEMIFDDMVLRLMNYDPFQRLSAEQTISELDKVRQACR